jgi:hypothetical protein
MEFIKLKLSVFDEKTDQMTIIQLESRLEPDLGIKDGQLIGIDFVNKPICFDVWSQHDDHEEVTLVKAADTGLTFTVYYKSDNPMGQKDSVFVPWSNIACLLMEEEVAV